MKAHTTMAATFALSFNAQDFAKACDNFNGLDSKITTKVRDAMIAGKDAIECVIAAFTLCQSPFSDSLIGAIRTTASRARKLLDCKYSLVIGKHEKGIVFTCALSADITRAAGAGRKSKSKPVTATPTPTPAPSNDAALHRVTDINARFAAALRALGLDDAQLRIVAKTDMTPDAIRALVVPATADRPASVRSARRSTSAALASVA